MNIIDVDDGNDNDNSLKLYKINQKNFSLLTNVAKNSLCIPITYISTCWITMTDLWSKLSPKNLKACVLYKTNKIDFL